MVDGGMGSWDGWTGEKKRKEKHEIWGNVQLIIRSQVPPYKYNLVSRNSLNHSCHWIIGLADSIRWWVKSPSADIDGPLTLFPIRLSRPFQRRKEEVDGQRHLGGG